MDISRRNTILMLVAFMCASCAGSPGTSGLVDAQDEANTATSSSSESARPGVLTDASEEEALDAVNAFDAYSEVDSDSPDKEVEEVPMFDGFSGALVTTNCMFQDYPYALDILLSCGNERFDAELRLHTFKRHSYPHQKVFNDQLLTYREGQLWFDAYESPFCIRIDAQGRFQLTREPSRCAAIQLVEDKGTFRVVDVSSGSCATLEDAACGDHRGTGGYECGGISHRYLPLIMGACDVALEFTFQDTAGSCSNEYPDDACF